MDDSEDKNAIPCRWPVGLESRLDLVTLKLFVAIIEEHSIVRAAEREFIAPSAVSKRIAELEHTTRVQLLVRDRKGILPTAAGVALLRHARTILSDVAQLELEMIDFASGALGHVRIAASESALMYFVPQVLTSFSRDHPRIRVDLRAEVSPDVVAAVQRNEADIGIFWGDSPTGDLRVISCYKDRLVVVMASDHELAQRTSLCLAEVLDYEIVEQEPNSSVQALLLQAAGELGRPFRTRIRVRGYDAACSMALAGFGLAVVPDSFAARLAGEQNLAVMVLNDHWATRQYKICVRDGDQTSPAVTLLMDRFLAKAEPA